jgi:hypothetical protein
MIAGFVDGVQRAIDPGDHVIDDGGAIGRNAMRDACELVDSPRREGAADLLRGQVLELLSGKKATSGGASDTDVKDPTARPVFSPLASVVVTTQTPVG